MPLLAIPDGREGGDSPVIEWFIQKKRRDSGWYRVCCDDEDYERLSQFKWYVSVKNGRLKAIYRIDKSGPIMTNITMQHEVLGLPSHQIIDHKDVDPGNNCKDNLRPCSAGENRCNQRPRIDGGVKYKGVSYRRHAKKYAARVRLDGQETWLGYHNTAISAAVAYDEGAEKIHGEFAWLNRDHFPEVRMGGKGEIAGSSTNNDQKNDEKGA